MVVTDIFFPDYTGGTRRTLETARILTKMGHSIAIFSNKKKNQSTFELYENFKVYRKEMRELGVYLHKLINFCSAEPDLTKIKTIDSYLEIKNRLSFSDKIKDIYRHKLPIHKLIKVLPSLRKTVKIIKDERIDLVYERGGSYGLGVLAAKITGRKSIIDFIDILYSNWALKKCSRILSYFTAFQVPSFIPRSKIDKVFTSVDEKRFNPSIRKKNLNLNIDKNAIVGLYVGAFYHFHGLEFLVEAVKKLKEKSNLRIILLGTGEAFDKIKKLITTLNVKPYFILLGKVPFDEVPYYINSADFCLSLNIKQAIGLKLFEYMACSKPVIVSNLDIISKFFIDKKNVIFVRNSDPDDLVDKINFIIQNRETAKQIGKNARKLIEEKYTWKIHGKNIISSLKKII